jgi:hypothetical protein
VFADCDGTVTRTVELPAYGVVRIDLTGALLSWSLQGLNL